MALNAEAGAFLKKARIPSFNPIFCDTVFDICSQITAKSSALPNYYLALSAQLSSSLILG